MPMVASTNTQHHHDETWFPPNMTEETQHLSCSGTTRMPPTRTHGHRRGILPEGIRIGISYWDLEADGKAAEKVIRYGDGGRWTMDDDDGGMEAGQGPSECGGGGLLDEKSGKWPRAGMATCPTSLATKCPFRPWDPNPFCAIRLGTPSVLVTWTYSTTCTSLLSPSSP
jgi:hypothetical protein